MHGKQGTKDVLKFQKRKSDLHDFGFVNMIRFVISQQKEKIKEDPQQVSGSEESEDDESQDESEESDQEEQKQTKVEQQKPGKLEQLIQKSESEDERRDFLNDTLGIIGKDKEEDANKQKGFADELDKLFGSKRSKRKN